MRKSRSNTVVEYEAGTPEYAIEELGRCMTQILRALIKMQSIQQDESATADRTADIAGSGEHLLAIDSHLVRDLVTGGEEATLCDQVIAQSEIVAACESVRSGLLRLPSNLPAQPMQSFEKMGDLKESYIMRSVILPDRDNAGLKDTRTEYQLSQIATTRSDQRLFLEQNTYYTPTRSRVYGEANSSIRKNFQAGLSELLRELKKRDTEIVHVDKLEKDNRAQSEQELQRCTAALKWLSEKNKGQENSYLASELRYRQERARRMDLSRLALRYNFVNHQSYLYWVLEEIMRKHVEVAKASIIVKHLFLSSLGFIITNVLPSMLKSYHARINLNEIIALHKELMAMPDSVFDDTRQDAFEFKLLFNVTTLADCALCIDTLESMGAGRLVILSQILTPAIQQAAVFITACPLVPGEAVTQMLHYLHRFLLNSQSLRDITNSLIESTRLAQPDSQTGLIYAFYQIKHIAEELFSHLSVEGVEKTTEWVIEKSADAVVEGETRSEESTSSEAPPPDSPHHPPVEMLSSGSAIISESNSREPTPPPAHTGPVLPQLLLNTITMAAKPLEGPGRVSAEEGKSPRRKADHKFVKPPDNQLPGQAQPPALSRSKSYTGFFEEGVSVQPVFARVPRRARLPASILEEDSAESESHGSADGKGTEKKQNNTQKP